MRRGFTSAAQRRRRPRPRESLNRFGPADPGLNSSVLPNHSTLGWCVWPKTQMSGRSIQKGLAVLRELPTFIQNMTDGDAAACQLDHGLGRISALFTIDVAGDGGDQSHLLQLFDHGPIANVPGVENVIDASEMSPDGRIEQAVGIGNDADPNVSVVVHGTATG